MLLGNRLRHPMRRTTSISSIVPIPVASTEEDPTGGDSSMKPVLDFKQDVGGNACSESTNLGMVIATNLYGVGAPSGGGLSSGWYQRDAVEATAHFLQTCGLCKRRLFPGRDIYMLRGDTAFCSSECRGQMMKQEKRKSRRNPNNPCSPKPNGSASTGWNS